MNVKKNTHGQGDDAGRCGISPLRAARSGRDDRGPAARSGRDGDGGLTRRSFLTGAAALVGGTALAAAAPAAAYAVEPGVIGDWAADGSKDVAVPDSSKGNASGADGTYREHNAAAFPANDSTPIPPRPVPAKWDYECEICVVGAGGGGLNAAARAAELGADVICIEAMGLHGGNAQSAGMCAILGGSKLQESKRFAFPEYPFDARKLTDWAMDEYHYAADPHLIYRIAESGGPCIDWMADCGVQWRLGEVPVYVAPKNSTLDHHVLKMKDATDAMFSFGQRKGVDYHFQCPAEALVQDDAGRVVGVVAREDFEREVYIHATKAVILTAGGFCNNKALLKEYIPTAAMGCASSYLVGGETGECFRMGRGVDADVSGFNSSASFDGGVDWEAEGGPWARFLYDGMTQLSRQPWFTVDRCGNRLRYMDSRVKKDGADAIYALGDLATIQMTPPGHRGYIIFDGNYEDHLAGFAQEHCRKLITPDLEQIDKVPEHYRDWHHGVQDAIDADVLKKRDTLEELERDLGFEEGVLVEAVRKWNETCARGEDDFMYPMPPEWLHEISTPPFYGCRIGGNLYGTKAGLLINDEMQVISTKGTPIPGLYAGWHTAGGACGENSYIGDPILGSLLGDVSLAFCGGYLCGTFAMQNEMEGKVA